MQYSGSLWLFCESLKLYLRWLLPRAGRRPAQQPQAAAWRGLVATLQPPLSASARLLELAHQTHTCTPLQYTGTHIYTADHIHQHRRTPRALTQTQTEQAASTCSPFWPETTMKTHGHALTPASSRSLTTWWGGGEN